MKKRILLTAACLALAAPARTGVVFDEYGVMSFSGGYYGTKTTVEAPVGKGFYRIGARARTFRFTDGPRGTEAEYSAHLSRELYHVTVKGRLGTAPPNMQRAAYRLAQGEASLTFYGLSLGPEHPELSELVWESTGPAPAAESLDRTWVTRVGMVYTNTDHHLERNPTASPAILIVIENTWQFEVRETWKQRFSLALQGGGDRYSVPLRNSAQVILKDNIDYAGNPFAVWGWPNNWVGAEAWQKYGSWTLSEGFTRLNLLDSKLQAMYGLELAYELGPHWRLRSGYFRSRRRGNSTGREAATFGVTCLW